MTDAQIDRLVDLIVSKVDAILFRHRPGAGIFLYPILPEDVARTEARIARELSRYEWIGN